MKIDIIGGGPAGLYFALLMKGRDAGHDITIYEQNRADDTFGFGVVFSAETLGHFRDYDAETYHRMAESFAYWDDIDIHFKGAKITSRGHGFCGMSRRELLLLMQARCRDLGVTLNFETEITSLDQVAGADLVLAANGINSWIRETYAADFRPSYDWRPNKFVWLGSTKRLDAFTFDFRADDAGIWNLHAYQYDDDLCTWIVETTGDAWEKAGMAEASEADTIAYMENLYADLLGGERIVANRSLWRNFPTIRCENWVRDNVVLMGDAAHTAHFSIGSGTKLAMEDAIALFEAFRTHGDDVTAALAAYSTDRRDEVARIQHAAETSLVWFEHVDRYWDMEPEQFAFSLLSRSKQITYDNLQLRDPEFVADVREKFAAGALARHGLPPAEEAPPPMFLPLRLRGMELANRVAVSPMCQYCAEDGMPTDWHYVHYTSRALGGAGLVMTEMTCPAPDARITPGCTGIWTEDQAAAWSRIVDFVHGRTAAKIALQIGHAGRKGATKRAWDGIDQPLPDDGWELISASPLPYLPQSQVPREMTEADMERVTAEFVAATRRAADCGFDMLELHMAHGYLLAGFLSPVTNRRIDAWGGSPDNRLRFPLAVLDAVRAAWPADRPLSVRISAHDWVDGGNTGDDAVAIARALKAHGADVINVSTGQTTPDEKPVYGRMFQAPFSEQVRIEAEIPTIVAGNITTWDQVNTLVAAGRADIVALARTHLYNPYFTEQAAAHYGYTPVPWPRPYESAKLAAFRQFERDRDTLAELRSAARPVIPRRQAAE